MKKALVPVVFSTGSENALQHAVQCACNRTRQWILVHMIDPIDVADLGLPGLVEYEDRLQTELWHGSIPAAFSEDAAAIVMGSPGRGAPSGTLPGSATEKVVRKTPRTVIVNKPPAIQDKLRRRWQTPRGIGPWN